MNPGMNPNPLQAARVKRRSEASRRLFTIVRDHLFQEVSLVWSYNGNRSLPPSTTLHGIGNDREDAQHTPGPARLRPT